MKKESYAAIFRLLCTKPVHVCNTLSDSRVRPHKNNSQTLPCREDRGVVAGAAFMSSGTNLLAVKVTR